MCSACIKIADRTFDSQANLILIDIDQPGGLRILQNIREQNPKVGIVATSSDPTPSTVVKAVRVGANEFLRKPFQLNALENTLSSIAKVACSNISVPSHLRIQTENEKMQSLVRQAEDAARTPATVLIVGESGTGKDRLSRLIHQRGVRSDGPYVVVNCAGLPNQLAESELFGHRKGAFTGAFENRKGQVLSASGGTLVLDEISEASLELQPKLLRLLQEREVQPLGASGILSVDLRVIATSQRDLHSEVLAGRFREDLYYRLDVIVLQIPPLRERKEDIPLLASKMLEQHVAQLQSEMPRLSSSTLEKMRNYPFRGNVRELENLMHRAVLLFSGKEINWDELIGVGKTKSQAVAVSHPSDSFNLRDLERTTIIRSLERFAGNRREAAGALGISERTLRNKIRLYELR